MSRILLWALLLSAHRPKHFKCGLVLGKVWTQCNPSSWKYDASLWGEWLPTIYSKRPSGRVWQINTVLSVPCWDHRNPMMITCANCSSDACYKFCSGVRSMRPGPGPRIRQRGWRPNWVGWDETEFVSELREWTISFNKSIICSDYPPQSLDIREVIKTVYSFGTRGSPLILRCSSTKGSWSLIKLIWFLLISGFDNLWVNVHVLSSHRDINLLFENMLMSCWYALCNRNFISYNLVSTNERLCDSCNAQRSATD
jgi:hypothetical protein